MLFLSYKHRPNSYKVSKYRQSYIVNVNKKMAANVWGETTPSKNIMLTQVPITFDWCDWSQKRVREGISLLIEVTYKKQQYKYLGLCVANVKKPSHASRRLWVSKQVTTYLYIEVSSCLNIQYLEDAIS